MQVPGNGCERSMQSAQSNSGCATNTRIPCRYTKSAVVYNRGLQSALAQDKECLECGWGRAAHQGGGRALLSPLGAH